MINSIPFNPRVIAHRGASGYAPENTIVAFTLAAQMGIQWVEFDVEQAACKTPIIIHDETLERTTSGQGNVIDYPYHYLRTLDAGSWFDLRYAGERIPSLQQVIECLRATNLSANVEIKALPGQEESLVLHTLDVITPYLQQAHEKILFSSFSIEALQLLRRYAPSAQMGLLLHEWLPGWEEVSQSLDCVSIHVFEEIMTKEMARKIKNMDKLLLCYTVNDPIRAATLYSWGVDAVFSDVPDKIVSSSML